jgi:hypothetical protein
MDILIDDVYYWSDDMLLINQLILEQLNEEYISIELE